LFNAIMRDYWLSKLFFDLQTPAAAAEYRASREAVLARYPLKPEVRAAVEANDVAALAPLVNAYLLRFYFLVTGMPEAEFLQRIRATARTTVKDPHG
jgi:Aromatic-ring-opening dioxygenase LigAB, LigA subunit